MIKQNSFLPGFMILCFLLTTSIPAAAQSGAPGGKSTLGLSVADDLRAGGGGSEYVAGKYPGAVMMKVNLWGGVRQPGIYHVPVGTDLVTLLSYAGGPKDTADLSDTHIKRTADTKSEVIEVDVDDIMRGNQVPELNLGLRVNDIVVVPESKPVISQNTLLILSVVATITSIAVATVVIARR